MWTSVLLTTLSMSGISVALAVVILVAERFLNDYGTVKVDINGGAKTLEAQGGASLLSTLASHQVFLPSACGGKATCGLCKVKVLEGGGTLLPTEEPYLTPAERAAGMRLACQLKVKRDLKIEVPEALFSIQEFKTRIERIDDLTYDIKGYRFALLDPPAISFKAGQYVQLYSEPYGQVKECVFRAYSMAQPPSDEKAVELYLRLVPDGVVTTWAHTRLKVGDPVRLSGPYGEFYLRGNCKDLVLIAGGSGLAPIRSLVYDIVEKGLPYTMTFFFGAVSKRDLYALDEFHGIAAKHPNFRFVPALSKPAPDDGWTGEVGLITEVVDRHVPDAVDREAYLCGSPGMLNACINVLTKKGFGNDRIFFDKFA